MREIIYISVILPLKLEWEPCYCLPDSCVSSDVYVGDRVKVKFAGKQYSGVISKKNIIPQTEISKIKSIDEIENDLDRILPEEIELWRRVADYYMCSIGEVYKAAYPSGKINLETAHATALQKIQQRRERLIDGMNGRIQRIQDRLAKKEELIAKSKEGTKAKAKYTEEAEKIKSELQIAREALEEALKKESTDGLPVISTPDTKIDLNEAQQAAYNGIVKAFAEDKPVMLHGVTGSGKTEIYIKIAKEILSKGKSVLYLVPEIALSRQLEERLQEHFGERLLTFHSAETAVSRRNTADAVRSRDGYIVLGTRSALFLPHHDLGLIIVDEEHDSSYKQDSPAPRYNGRDTALMLSVIHGSKIILGSATPSLEEIYNCHAGRHELITLNEKYHGSGESDIEIIDTKAERRKRGMTGNFSRKLIDHINRTLAEGGQVMILRTKRAWASAVQCEECGEIQKCPHCNVSMSLHKTSSDRLVCHYCGCSIPFTGKCNKCGGALKGLGAGTQKIEEETAALFPNARIARLDSDSAQNRSYESRVIKEFGKGEIDILIGTQMLTKGFDFERLSLTAVIAADTFLGIQDFRADEKALQVLEQFRGRCGRRGRKGLFVIQTSQPEHPVYQKLTSSDINLLSTDLLVERKDFNFPPYTRIIEVTFKDTNENRAIKMASLLADKLRGSFELAGPYSPAVDKVADMHIRIIRASLKKDRKLSGHKVQILKTIREFEKSRRYEGHISINVDPT